MSWTSDVVREVLPNGLTVLVRRDGSAPVVAVVTHVKAGYFDEPDEWVGIAHVLEHMYFKGTLRRGPGEIARETQLLGGHINAGTIYDRTVYYTVLPSSGNGLERAVDIQADALRNAALDEEELRRELEVIIQEAKRKLDTPSAVTHETLFDVLFRVHRMRRWRIGTEEELRRLSHADVRAYYESRYRPDRVVVGIVGDIDPDDTLRVARSHYGDWERRGEPVPGSPTEPAGVEPVIRILHGDVKRPLAVLGWRTVATLHPDAAALDVASGVLGSGRGSHLYRALRLRGLASGASAGHYTPTEVGVFSIALETDAATLDAAVIESLRLAEAMRRGSVSVSDIDRVKAMVTAQWLRRFESMEGQASTLCEAEALGDLGLVDELYERVLNVTREDVLQVACHYLDPAVACGVLFLPDGTESSLDGAWPPQANGMSLRASPVRAVPSAAGAVPPGRIPDAEELCHGVFRRNLPSVDILARRRAGSGLVTIGLQVAGLPTAESSADAGISWLLVRSALRGAGGMSGEELAQATERLGGAIGPSVHKDALGWWITVPVVRFREAAALLRIVATDPELNPSQIELERGLMASDARHVQDDMFRHPVQRVLGRAFDGHAYGLPPLGDPAQLETLEPVAVRRWSARLKGAHALAIAVGDLEPEALLDGLAPLAEWEGVADLSGRALPVFGAARGEEERRKQQTAVAMAFPASRFGSPDRHVLRVIGALMSGLAGRLFEELREKRSLAYTVSVFPWLAAGAGVMLTYIATSPEREAEARDAMLMELARICRDPPSDTELDCARNYVAGSEEIRLQSGRAITEEIVEAWIKGTVDDLADSAARIRAVTRDDVLRVSEEVFQAEKRAEYIVRGVGSAQ